MGKKNLLLRFALTLLVSTNQIAEAQIIYTDVVPDKTFKCPKKQCSQTYPLDLNNDGIIDFNLEVRGTPSQRNSYDYTYGVSVVALNSNSFCVYDLSSSLTLALSNGTLIGSSLSWISTVAGTLRSNYQVCYDMCSATCVGLWLTSSDSYLGLKIVTGNGTHYGWARLSVDVPCGSKNQSASFTIKDYAYNLSPDQPIIAGTSSGAGILRDAVIQTRMELPDRYKINVYPNPSYQSVTISLSFPQTTKVNVRVFDLIGRLLTTLVNEEMAAGDHQLTWNGRDSKGHEVSTGVYLLRTEIGGKADTRKITMIK